MRRERVEYEADGLTLRSELFVGAATGRRPAVLVFPEAFGLGDHDLARGRAVGGDGLCRARQRPARRRPADQRARPGHRTAAAALRRPGEDARASRRGSRRVVRPPRGRREPRGRDRLLLRRDRGARARRSRADIKALVGFHSGLGTVASAAVGAIKTKILVCIGANDPFIPPEQRATLEAEMRASGTDWQMHLYGETVHSLTNREAVKT